MGARRSGYARAPLANWLVVRVTAIILAVLVLGHFAQTHFITDVADTDSTFVARRWASPLYIVWDWTMLAAAVIHGAAGLWVAIGEYATGSPRTLLRRGLVALSIAMLAAGTATILIAAGIWPRS